MQKENKNTWAVEQFVWHPNRWENAWSTISVNMNIYKNGTPLCDIDWREPALKYIVDFARQAKISSIAKEGRRVSGHGVWSLEFGVWCLEFFFFLPHYLACIGRYDHWNGRSCFHSLFSLHVWHFVRIEPTLKPTTVFNSLRIYHQFRISTTIFDTYFNRIGFWNWIIWPQN